MNPLAAILEVAFQILRALIEGILGAFGVAFHRAVTPIDIRRASPEEVIDVRHEVLRAGKPRETAVFDGDQKKTTRHWVAVQADRVIGVVSVMAAEMPSPHPDPQPRWQLRGMAILPDLQKSGVGRAMLEAVHAEVNDDMWCNARTHVEGFYARGGWARSGEAFEIEGVGPHVRMTWAP